MENQELKIANPLFVPTTETVNNDGKTILYKGGEPILAHDRKATTKGVKSVLVKIGKFNSLLTINNEAEIPLYAKRMLQNKLAEAMKFKVLDHLPVVKVKDIYVGSGQGKAISFPKTPLGCDQSMDYEGYCALYVTPENIATMERILKQLFHIVQLPVTAKAAEEAGEPVANADNLTEEAQ